MVSEVIDLTVSWQDKDYVIFFVLVYKMKKFLKDEVRFAAAGFS
jgi:hypothetical protein